MAEVEGIEKRWSLFKTAQDIVDTKFDDGRDYATDALRVATETINDLKEVSSEINTIDTSIVFPVITPPSLGTFSSVAPTAPSLDINFPDAPPETGDLQAAVHDKLLADITDSTPAITSSVEDSIFKRDFERSELVLADTIDKINDEWSKRGFTLPNAMLLSNITQAVTEHGNKRTDVSRDIAIKNFELTDTNMKFAIQQGLAYVTQRIQTYKIEVDAEAARIDSIVRKYLGEVDVYKGTAQVYTALADVNIKQFDAELQYEVAKANLLIKNVEVDIKNFEVMNGLKVEAMKAIGSINAQVVAGALSSVSASAQISASNSGQYSFSSNPSY